MYYSERMIHRHRYRPTRRPCRLQASSSDQRVSPWTASWTPLKGSSADFRQLKTHCFT